MFSVDRARPAPIWSTEQAILVVSSLLILLQFAYHLLTDSDIVCALYLALTLGVAVLFLAHGGVRDLSSLLGLLFIARYVGIASVVKAVLGQTIDSNLVSPRSAFLMAFLCAVQLYAAYRLVSWVPLPFMVMPENHDRGYLAMLSWIAFAVGSTIMVISSSIPAHSDTAGEGIGTFMFVVYGTAIVARTMYVLTDPERFRDIDAPLALMIGSGFFFAMISDTKHAVFLAFSCYFMTVVFRRRSFSLTSVLIPSAALIFIVLVFGPLINMMRGASASAFGGRIMKELTLMERFEAMERFVASKSLADHLATHEDNEQKRSNLEYPYFGNVGSLGITLERVGMVQNVDLVKGGIDANGRLGLWLVTWPFGNSLPRIIVGGKFKDSMCDMIYWHAGVLPRGHKHEMTLGIIGSAYAMDDWTSVCYVPFILFTLFYLVQKLWAGHSSKNVWAVAFFSDWMNTFVEADVSQFITTLIREIPLHVGLMYVVHLMAVSLQSTSRRSA